MNISDMEYADVIEKGLSWDDFGDRSEIIKSIVQEAIEDDMLPPELPIVSYLDEKMAKCVFKPEEIHPLSFYSVNLTVFACIDIAKGKLSSSVPGKGAVSYAPDYSSMNLLIEDVGQDGIFAVYMKDYSFGYMKPFGECLYDLQDEFFDALESGKIEGEEEAVEKVFLPMLEKRIVDGEIDLEKEFYSYYHDIPNTKIPGMEEQLNEDLVSVKEASGMLGVSTARVKKMVADHVLDGFKRNGLLWLSKEEVQSRIDYIDKHGKPTRGKTSKAKLKA